jgi:Flp pilus assembly protein protease CpaA
VIFKPLKIRVVTISGGVSMTAYVLRLSILAPCLFYAGLSDLRSRKIDNKLSIFLLASGLCLPLWSGWDIGWNEVAISTCLTFIVTLIPWLMKLGGAGDTKLLTGVASLVGYSIWSIVVLAAAMTAVALVPLLLTRKLSLKSRIPAAPGIAVATLLCLI